MKKVPYEIIVEIQDHINDFWAKENIATVISWGCLGHLNSFYIDGKLTPLECTGHYASDIQDIKIFFEHYITSLWEYATLPRHSVALHIEDIIDMDGWYNVIVGGCLFEDVTN